MTLIEKTDLVLSIRWEGAMKKGKKLGLFLALVLVILAQLACEAATGISDLGKVDCESKGGKWRQEVDSNGRLE